MAESKRGIASKMMQAIGVLVVVIIVLPLTLYIPFVQNIVKNYACEWASEKTGYHITIDRLLLKFPLDISLDSLLVLDQQRDTMMRAANFTAGVEFRPLLDLNVNVDRATLSQALYRLATEDSSMLMRVNADLCQIDGIEVDLNNNLVNLVDASLKGGNITLDYFPHNKVTECDTTQAKPWKIRAYRLALDDIDYTMTMLPTIDRLTTHISHARLVDGIVDTGMRTVNARSLAIDTVTVAYFYPTPEFARDYAAQHPVPRDTLCNPADTIPWTIKADSLALRGSHAVYALAGTQCDKGRGLNANHIKVADINLLVTDFYNRGSNVNLNLANLTLGEEGSGVDVTQCQGKIALNDKEITADKVVLKTLLSDLNIDAHIDLSALDSNGDGQVRLSTDSHIALQDVQRLVPSLAPMLKGIPQLAPVAVKGVAAGNLPSVDITSLPADLPKYAHATVSGKIANPTDFKKMTGALRLNARFDNINFIKPTMLDQAMAKQVNFPPLTVNGTAKLDRGRVAADAVMTVADGRLVGTGTFNSHNDEYSLDAALTNFPVRAILPLSNTDNLTANVNLTGKGFDFLNPATDVAANVQLTGVNYNNEFYHNLNADLAMSGGALNGRITSANDNCRLDLNVNGQVNGRHYIVDLTGDIFDLNLQALGVTKEQCDGHGRINGQCDIDLDRNYYDAQVDLTDFAWAISGNNFVAQKASATFNADSTSTRATFDNEDNHVNFTAACGIDTLISRFTASANIALNHLKHNAINIDTLQAALPHFAIDMNMGTDGLVQRMAQNYGIDWRKITFSARNDSSFFAKGYVNALSIDGTNIDTLTRDCGQWHNKYLAFSAHRGNRPVSMDEFASVTVEGGVKGSTLDFLVTQHNINKEMGYRLGCHATLTDSVVNTRFFPEQPVIGYRKWNINPDNFVNLNYGTRMLDANLNLESDSSTVSLVTKREVGATNEDICLKINNLRIEEWTKFLPNLDPMSGVLNADIDVGFDGRAIDGKGSLGINNLVYNGMREGDFTINTDFGVDPTHGGTRLNVDMLVDGSHVAMALGSINEHDTIAPLKLEMQLDRFPLSKVSPFIPGGLLRLRGYANGQVSMSGTGDNQRINGSIVGDSAFVTVPRYGASLRLSNDKLTIVDNVLKFNNYKILGQNDNNVAVNGMVDATNLDNMIIDLSMAGKNIQVINTEQRGFSELFGKGFVDINASVRGRGNYMTVRADVKLLPGSNLTYVLQEELSSLTSSVDKNMVTFVNLSDSTGGTPYLVTAKAATATNMQINIDVQQGAKINAFLSPTGEDRATLDGSGMLKYSIDFAGKNVLTGTYTVESGSLRYTPPLISQKNFEITSGSTVAWTGDMLNPQLNLTGTERNKTSVSGENGGSRLVEFLVTAHVGGTLNSLKLDFDLSTESDLDVMNELQTMSSVQRSQAAINLLLYGNYSGTNSAGSVTGLTASNALFSFLQSKLNSWAAKTIKGVDLSFGINQFGSSTGKGTETSYSYRLSKSLFNDRFKIVVGGEYSTEASNEVSIAQNLLNDISFEYMLNDAGSRYVQLFRRTGYESVLEGQVTTTGVAFVMKHKLASLKSLFRRKPLKLTVMDTIAAPKNDDELPDSTSATQ